MVGKQSIPLYKKWIRLGTFGFMAVMLLFFVAGFQAWAGGRIDSVENFRTYIEGYGIFAPVLLVLFQVAQVLVPVLPGLFGCAAGTLMFGCVGGFPCNYIGISVGFVAAFLLARKYGAGFVRELLITSVI